MISEKDIPDDRKSLEHQIQVRHELQGKMGGGLYPSILQDEINRLRDRISIINHDEWKSEEIIDV